MKFIGVIVAISASQLLWAGHAFGGTAAPGHTAAAKPIAAASTPAAAGAKHRSTVRPVDINSASPAQLAKLPGLSAADAQRVIAGRPYLTKAHLVTHKVVSEAQYDRIKGIVFAGQKGPAPARVAK